MKRVIFTITAFIICSSLAWAVPDYKGYRQFLKENDQKIKTMEKSCRDSKGTPNNKKICDDVLEFRFTSECKYGVNPNACKAMEEINKLKIKRSGK